jgi:hypothetical protein
VVIPNGRPTLLKELRQRDKNVKIIFVSGYAEEAFSRYLPVEQYPFSPSLSRQAACRRSEKTLVQ